MYKTTMPWMFPQCPTESHTQTHKTCVAPVVLQCFVPWTYETSAVRHSTSLPGSVSPSRSEARATTRLTRDPPALRPRRHHRRLLLCARPLCCTQSSRSRSRRLLPCALYIALLTGCVSSPLPPNASRSAKQDVISASLPKRWFLCVSSIPPSLLTANKRLCVCRGISCLPSVSFSFIPLPLLTTITFWLFCLPPSVPPPFSPAVFACRVLQASVGRCHSPQAAEHLPFFTQGGWGERLPPDRHQQSHRSQRSQSQGPRYRRTKPQDTFYEMCVLAEESTIFEKYWGRAASRAKMKCPGATSRRQFMLVSATDRLELLL